MLWFILILISAVVFGLPTGLFIAWCANCHDYPKIKYKDFQRYYDTHPDRWYCYEYRVAYHRYIDTYTEMYESFNFGFIDFCRYILWQFRLEKVKKRKARAESMQRFLDDINKTEAENDSM